MKVNNERHISALSLDVDYIAQTSSELALLARAKGPNTLAALLDSAAREAETHITRAHGPRDPNGN